MIHQLMTHPFLLAPMAGITDSPFRSFMREMGAGAVVSELVSATGLHYGSENTKRLMRFESAQRPVGIQLFGEDPEHLQSAAREVERLGADFVDLNFGCPVPKVVKKGAGAACLRDLGRLREILQAVKGAVSLPVTIKIRTGWDDQSRNSIDIARLAGDIGISWVAIHGRTRAAGYSGLADWDYIRYVKQNSPVPIIGNGDIHTAEEACRRLEESGCDAVMIGRGSLKNPWIFHEAATLWQGTDGQHSQVPTDFVELFARLQHHLEKAFDERMVILQAKKLSVWYSSGYPGASAFRKEIFSAEGKQQVFVKIHHYFRQFRRELQQDTRGEAFLMGGHG